MSHIPTRKVPRAKTAAAAQPKAGTRIGAAGAIGLAVGGAVAVGLAIAAAPLFRSKPEPKRKTRRTKARASKA